MPEEKITTRAVLNIVSGLSLGYLVWTFGTIFYPAIEKVGELELKLAVLEEKSNRYEADIANIKASIRGDYRGIRSNDDDDLNIDILSNWNDTIINDIRHVGSSRGYVDMRGDGGNLLRLDGIKNTSPGLPPNRGGIDVGCGDFLPVPTKYIFRLCSVYNDGHCDNLHVDDRGYL